MSASDSYMPIVYYDGYCGFCNTLITWLKRRGADKKVHLIPFQFVSNNATNELILVISGKYLEAGVAVHQLALYLGGWFKIPGAILGLFPTKLLNRLYYSFAANRYRWFGKTTCAIN